MQRWIKIWTHSNTWTPCKPFYCSSGFPFRVDVLLEGEPLRAVSSIQHQLLTGILVTVAEKHPDSTTLPPPCFIVGTVLSPSFFALDFKYLYLATYSFICILKLWIHNCSLRLSDHGKFYVLTVLNFLRAFSLTCLLCSLVSVMLFVH